MSTSKEVGEILARIEEVSVYDVEDLLRKRIRSGKYTMAMGDHWLYDVKRSLSNGYFTSNLRDEPQASLKGFLAGDPSIKFHIGSCIGLHCQVCQDEEVYVSNDKGQIKFEFPTKCPYPKAPERPYSVEIDVPSGKLVFANDFRDFFPLYDDHYVNYLGEIIRCTQDYAAEGMIHVNVGNTCPAVHQLDDGSIVCGLGGDEERYSEKAKAFVPVSKARRAREALPGRHVSRIGTDLWWVSACDADNLKARCAHFKKDYAKALKDYEAFEIDVAPGRYRVDVTYHMTRELADDGKYPAQFFTVKRMGEVRSTAPVPVKKADDLTFEQTIDAMAMMWPQMYTSRAKCLDRLFFVNGTSIEWHAGRLLLEGGRGAKAAIKRVRAGERFDFEGKLAARKAALLEKCKKAGREFDENELGPMGLMALDSFYPFSADYCTAGRVPDDVRQDFLDGLIEALDMAIALKGVKQRHSLDKDPFAQNNRNAASAAKIKDALVKRFADRIKNGQPA